MFLIELIKKLNSERVPYLLVGGYALALHGIVRATMDIDLVVSLKLKELSKVEKILDQLGLVSRIPVRAAEMAQFHQKYRREKNLVAWSFVDLRDPTRVVDLLIDPLLEKLKGKKIKVHGLTVKVATLESLLKMKLKAGRPIDLADVSRIQEILRENKRK